MASGPTVASWSVRVDPGARENADVTSPSLGRPCRTARSPLASSYANLSFSRAEFEAHPKIAASGSSTRRASRSNERRQRRLTAWQRGRRIASAVVASTPRSAWRSRKPQGSSFKRPLVNVRSARRLSESSLITAGSSEQLAVIDRRDAQSGCLSHDTTLVRRRSPWSETTKKHDRDPRNRRLGTCPKRTQASRGSHRSSQGQLGREKR